MKTQPFTSSSGVIYIVRLRIISPLYQYMDWGNEVMSHRTDWVSLNPTSPLPPPSPPHTHCIPLTPSPPEVRGRALELVTVRRQVQGPLGILIEPTWCSCHVTKCRSHPSIPRVKFTEVHPPFYRFTPTHHIYWLESLKLTGTVCDGVLGDRRNSMFQYFCLLAFMADIFLKFYFRVILF